VQVTDRSRHDETQILDGSGGNVRRGALGVRRVAVERRSFDGRPPATPLSDAIQSQIRPDGWVRVLVELKLPSRAVPEASLRNLTAVLAQRQVIGARRERLLKKLPPGTYRLLREYLTIPYVAIDVTASSAAILADSASDIERVLPDALARPDLADSAPLVQADQAWSVGYDGAGVAVGIVDTGVDATHPFLAGKVASEACYSSTVAGLSESLCPNRLAEQHGKGAAAPCPFDDCFHGTHVAGVAAGDGRGAGQSFSGVARGAKVLAVQAFSRSRIRTCAPAAGRAWRRSPRTFLPPWNICTSFRGSTGSPRSI
jgi:subtilisin family serine protease